MKYLYALLGLFCTSYAFGQNLLSMQDWKVGTGSTGSYNINGQVSENIREWGEGPNGKRVVVWKAVPDGQSNDDGGFNWAHINIDHKNMYRFSIWLKKTNSHSGDSYLGCTSVNNVDGTANTNPYFWYGDLPELDKWYLVVGYVHGSDDASTIGYGGIYDGITGAKVSATTDFKFPVGATTIGLRSYLYYDPEVNDRQYFYAPRIDLVNGDEPTIASLLGIETVVNNNTKLIVQDTRAVATIPDSYARSVESHFKSGAILGLPSTYYTVLGLRGWNDDSGGKAHELAFSDEGNIYFRSGYTGTGWASWRSLILSNESGNIGLGTNALTAGTAAKWMTMDGTVNYSGGNIYSINGVAKSYNYFENGSHIIQSTAGNGIAFKVNGTADAAATILPNGNIGIGTAIPNEKLSVNGKIRAKEIKVETANWPDYVFEEGYKVGTLEELESYIKANKHLPDMPNAKELESNGLKVGEMLKLQQQKIEELTLQLIEMNKRLNNQQKEIKRLKTTKLTGKR